MMKAPMTLIGIILVGAIIFFFLFGMMGCKTRVPSKGYAYTLNHYSVIDMVPAQKVWTLLQWRDGEVYGVRIVDEDSFDQMMDAFDPGKLCTE